MFVIGSVSPGSVKIAHICSYTRHDIQLFYTKIINYTINILINIMMDNAFFFVTKKKYIYLSNDVSFKPNI